MSPLLSSCPAQAEARLPGVGMGLTLDSVEPAWIVSCSEQFLGTVLDRSWLSPTPVSSMLRGLECSLYPHLLAPGAGQEDRTQALPSALGPACATAPNPWAATAFLINAVVLLSWVLPEFSLSGRHCCPLHPVRPPSPARLACSPFLTLSHSLPLFLKSFCFSHMPVLSLAGSFSLIPPLFLS